MVTIFKLILLLVITISFFGAVAEKEQAIRDNMVIIFVVSLIAFIVSVAWL